MHYKLRLRDDPRIDSVVYFSEQMTVVAHIKQTSPHEQFMDDPVVESSDEEEKGHSKQAKRGGKTQSKGQIASAGSVDKFKKVTSLEEVRKQFKEGEYLVLRIFDKVKVLVDTTTEFPLDIKCSLVISPED